MVAGYGMAGLGSTAFGYGVPSMVNSSTAKLWIKADGTQGNCAKIDPVTGDYVLDANGNSVGDDSINQMVYLAFNTIFNTSAVRGFGFDISPDNAVISPAMIQRVKLSAFKAVKHLTDPRIVSIVSVDIKRISGTGQEVHIEWRNNSTGEINLLTF